MNDKKSGLLIIEETSRLSITLEEFDVCVVSYVSKCCFAHATMETTIYNSFVRSCAVIITQFVELECYFRFKTDIESLLSDCNDVLRSLRANLRNCMNATRLFDGNFTVSHCAAHSRECGVHFRQLASAPSTH